MRLLIVGGTKFIGPHVVRRLVSLGHHVTVYHRGENESPLPDAVRHVRAAEAGIPVRSFPPTLFAGTPDVAIHMIAMGEQDTRAAIDAFRGRISRAVWISSGDVYRAYGRFTGIEPGPIEPVPLTEDSPLRSVLYPYRAKADSPDDLAWSYEKVRMEQIAASDAHLPATILRLPKVYGPGGNADLATVHGFRDQPAWRWTHGFVENVAEAIVLAAVRPEAAGRIYNVGEAHTPTMAERLAGLPPSPMASAAPPGYNFAQDIVYDTSRIRRELGYAEPVPEHEAMLRTVTA